MSATRERSRWTTGLVALESALVFALLVVWLSSESVRASKHLAVLFFYSFPSEFLVGLIPHEPALIFFGMGGSAAVLAASTIDVTTMEMVVVGFRADRGERCVIRTLSQG